MINILYIGVAYEKNSAIAEFSRLLYRSFQVSHYKVYIFGDSMFYRYFNSPQIVLPDMIKTIKWNIVIIQNSLCFSIFSEIIRSFRKTPVIFVSQADDITGYIAPFENLYAVFNLSEANLTLWDIPAELYMPLKIPVTALGNFYRHDDQPDYYDLVYYPVKYSTERIDSRILNFTNYFNCRLTVIGEEYRILKPALNSRVRIISHKQTIAAFKKAHLVMTSGHRAIQAIALCKPCVLVGDHGLGGKVTAENYELLKKYGFRGRAGAANDEFIPLDLLQAEIKRTLSKPCEDEMKTLQKMMLADGYSFTGFHRIVTQTVNQVLKLHTQIHNRQLQKTLKPCLSSSFQIQQINNKNIIVCGQIRFNDVDDELLDLLRHCDGKRTIEEIVKTTGYDRENIPVFAYSIMELWKKKLVIIR